MRHFQMNKCYYCDTAYDNWLVECDNHFDCKIRTFYSSSKKFPPDKAFRVDILFSRVATKHENDVFNFKYMICNRFVATYPSELFKINVGYVWSIVHQFTTSLMEIPPEKIKNIVNLMIFL